MNITGLRSEGAGDDSVCLHVYLCAAVPDAKHGYSRRRFRNGGFR